MDTEDSTNFHQSIDKIKEDSSILELATTGTLQNMSLVRPKLF